MTSEKDRGHRVVITGLGAVSPVGNDVHSTWEALLAGTSGAGPITAFETDDEWSCRIACQVDGFDPDLYLDAKESRRYDRYSQFALASSIQAMKQAGYDQENLPDVPPERFGVIFGSGIGGIATLEETHENLLTKGPRRVSPFFVPMFIPDIAAGLISIHFKARGVNFATVSACASSAHAIGEAFRAIERGDVDIMIAGGAEATITPLTVAGFSSMRAMSTRNDEPERASRPFDAGRDGFVIGEGSGAVILESLERARDRGAEILAELVGYGASADAYHITQPVPEGKGAQHAVRLALEDGQLDTGDVDYINAHGTSTPHNDKTETAAVKAVFGDDAYDLVMGSTKSMTGHLLGAAGGLEAVICTLVCREGKIPPTINYEEPDPECDLDCAPNEARERDVGVALTNSFGFGGHNVCLALRRWEG